MQHNQIADQMTLELFASTPLRDDEGLNVSPVDREADFDELTRKKVRKRTSQELQELRSLQRRRATFATKPETIEDINANLDLIERLEAENMPYTAELIRSDPSVLAPSDITRVDTLLSCRSSSLNKLLKDLNINLDRGLSKSDTDNLLSALLVASEDQLEAILANPSVPVVIKTIIRRLLQDSVRGDTAAIERLWDRLFGKPANALAIATPAQQQAVQQPADNNIIPSTPISREAFVILRETLMQ